MAARTTPKRRLRILMLHGFTQSGGLFHAKTRALEKNLRKAFPPSAYDVSLHYPTGPCPILPADDMISSRQTPDDLAGASSAEDSYGWFVRKGETEPYVYDMFDEGLQRVAETLGREGPFDGVMGFSQGGFMASVVASLLEVGRRAAFAGMEGKGGMPFPPSFIKALEEEASNTSDDEGVIQPPLKFCVSYSGFGATPNVKYSAFYEPKIKTPVLSFLGSYDTVVSEERSLRLVDNCEPGRHSELGRRRLVYHPGGHFVPASQRQCLIPLIGFIRESMGWQEGSTDDVGGSKLEDLAAF